MSKAGYSVTTEGAVALVAATAKSVIGIKSGAAFGLDLQKARISFDGVTASAVPALVELCESTWATNPPSTNSTGTTPAQGYGRVLAHGITSAKNWTAEPTVLTVIDSLLLPVFMGVMPYDFPLGTTLDCPLGEGFVIRVTAPAVVNVRAALHWERC